MGGYDLAYMDWLLHLREEKRLKKFKNTMLRIPDPPPKKKEVTMCFAYV
jgi:hypothetical protein